MNEYKVYFRGGKTTTVKAETEMKARTAAYNKKGTAQTITKIIVVRRNV